MARQRRRQRAGHTHRGHRDAWQVAGVRAPPAESSSPATHFDARRRCRTLALDQEAGGCLATRHRSACYRRIAPHRRPGRYTDANQAPRQLSARCALLGRRRLRELVVQSDFMESGGLLAMNRLLDSGQSVHGGVRRQRPERLRRAFVTMCRLACAFPTTSRSSASTTCPARPAATAADDHRAQPICTRSARRMRS